MAQRLACFEIDGKPLQTGFRVRSFAFVFFIYTVNAEEMPRKTRSLLFVHSAAMGR
jgi:hypothetical protein